MTPLLSAASNISEQAIAFLLERGANPHAIDQRGFNALHHLASADTSFDEEEERPYLLPALQSLLEAGVDFSLRNADGDTPMDLANESGRLEMASRLQQVMLDASWKAVPAKPGPRL